MEEAEKKNLNIKKPLAVIVACVFVIIVCVIVRLNESAEKQEVEPTVIETVTANCTENGYEMVEREDGIFVEQIVPAKGHDFGEYEVISKSDGITPETRKRVCKTCGFEETDTVYNDMPIALLRLYGSINDIDKTHEARLTAKFKNSEHEFESYATLKNQGHSSLKYDKKNFTLKLFKDKSCCEKNKMTLIKNDLEHKYVLKANYIDATNCRNLFCADIWSRMVASRENVNPRLTASPNNGAISGFATAVYLNDEFYGIYNMCLHKDDDLFGMEKNHNDGVVIINSQSTDSSLFRKAADFDDEAEEWEAEFCGTENKSWLTDKANDLIWFVMNSDDKTFKNDLHKYLDVDSAIDYMLAMYALGLNTSYAKDLVLLSYDGSPLIASLYDMENAFGLSEDGTAVSKADFQLPERKNGVLTSGTKSLLWDRLIKCFEDEVTVRYAYLRKNILAPDKMCEDFSGLVSAVPSRLVTADENNFPQKPKLGDKTVAEITDHIKERIYHLDSIFQYEKEN